MFICCVCGFAAVLALCAAIQLEFLLFNFAVFAFAFSPLLFRLCGLLCILACVYWCLLACWLAYGADIVLTCIYSLPLPLPSPFPSSSFLPLITLITLCFRFAALPQLVDMLSIFFLWFIFFGYIPLC